MKLYSQVNDIPLIGIRVNSFPNGIKEAFDYLAKQLGLNRSYYGISWMDESNRIIYYAMAEEVPGERELYNFEYLTLKKGDYQTESIHDWMSKTSCIKDVFHELMQFSKPDRGRPCVEWYRSVEEMLCMVPV